MNAIIGSALSVAPASAAPLLAYRPLLDPLDIDPFWLALMLPLVIVIAVVYKTIKLADLADLPRQAAVLAVQIVLFMVLAAAALWLLGELA